MMAMQEYPTVLIGAKVSLPSGSPISTFARNRDCEVSQWRRALNFIRGMAKVYRVFEASMWSADLGAGI